MCSVVDSIASLPVCQRLKSLYFSQITCADPSLRIIFHCAVGLSQTDELTLASDILEDLIDQNYCVDECRLALAKAMHQHGYQVKARRTLDQLLKESPLNQEARDFDKQLNKSVARDGKLFIYTIAALAGLTAIFLLYRRTRVASSQQSHPNVSVAVRPVGSQIVTPQSSKPVLQQSTPLVAVSQPSAAAAPQ